LPEQLLKVRTPRNHVLWLAKRIPEQLVVLLHASRLLRIRQRHVKKLNARQQPPVRPVKENAIPKQANAMTIEKKHAVKQARRKRSEPGTMIRSR
jgi:hypothetical protein